MLQASNVSQQLKRVERPGIRSRLSDLEGTLGHLAAKLETINSVFEHEPAECSPAVDGSDSVNALVDRLQMLASRCLREAENIERKL